MDKNETLKKEGLYILLTFLIAAIIFQIIFIKENTLAVVRTVAALFWLFALPGFALMYYWHEKLDFLERLIIGTVLGLAVVGVIGYNLSVIGLHMKYHAIILPAAMIAIGAFAVLKNKP